ncbi:MAG: acyltransferase [Candidatus Helarchaeota archaeon]
MVSKKSSEKKKKKEVIFVPGNELKRTQVQMRRWSTRNKTLFFLVSTIHDIAIGIYTFLFNHVIDKFPFPLRKILYKWLYRVKIGKGTYIENGLYSCYDISHISIGNNTYIGRDVTLWTPIHKIYIGNNVKIGREAQIYTVQHNVDDPEFDYIGNSVIIKDNAVIGPYSIIFAGTIIREGEKIPPNKIVFSRNPKYTIAQMKKGLQKGVKEEEIDTRSYVWKTMQEQFVKKQSQKYINTMLSRIMEFGKYSKEEVLQLKKKMRGFFWGKIPSFTIRMFIYRRIYKMKIGKLTHIHENFFCINPSNISIDKTTIIGNNVFMDGRHGIEIGTNCQVNGEVILLTETKDRKGPIKIEDYAWIAARSTILPGVTIGKGAVISGGSLVTEDVPPYHVVGGCPVKFMKKRNEDLRYTLSFRRLLA